MNNKLTLNHFNLNFNWNYNLVFSVKEKKFRHYKTSNDTKDTQERQRLRGYTVLPNTVVLNITANLLCIHKS